MASGWYVQAMMPSGIKKAATVVGMPVMAEMVAAPPRRSMEVTKTLVRRQKPRKTLWAAGPHLGGGEVGRGVGGGQWDQS